LLETPDSRGSTPLHAAIEAYNYPAVSFLLDQGADFEAQSLDNVTPMQLAAVKEFPRAVFLLRQFGAEPKVFEADPGLAEYCRESTNEALRKSLNSFQAHSHENTVGMLVTHGSYGAALKLKRQALEGLLKRAAMEDGLHRGDSEEGAMDMVGRDSRPAVVSVSPIKKPGYLRKKKGTVRFPSSKK